VQRPRGLTELEVTPAEAAEIAANTDVAGYSPKASKKPAYSDPTAGAPPKDAQEFGVRGYDSTCFEPGEQLGKVRGKFRTSNRYPG
jgi:hypothetical protein